MEQLDRPACEALARRCSGPVFVADEYDWRDIVSLLRCSSWLVSSRYHAIVCTMPAGVPSIGVTIDERIRNLMAERGTPELCIEADDANLARHVAAALRTNETDFRLKAERCVAENLRRLGRMNRRCAEEIAHFYRGAGVAPAAPSFVPPR
jgi:polysaccharide pyruvyl transferase WcaK-like protein